MTKLEYLQAWVWIRIDDIYYGFVKCNYAYKVWKLTILQKYPHGTIFDYLDD